MNFVINFKVQLSLRMEQMKNLGRQYLQNWNLWQNLIRIPKKAVNCFYKNFIFNFWIGLRLKLVFSQRFRILRKKELQVHLLLASKNKEEGERNLVPSIFAANFICPNRSCLDFSFALISKETVQSNFHFYGKHQDIFSITDALTQPYKKQIGVDQLISSYPLSMSVCLVIPRILESLAGCLTELFAWLSLIL